METVNWEFRAGDYRVYHTGPMHYAVTEKHGIVLRSFGNVADAFNYAIRCHEAAKLVEKQEVKSNV